MLILIVKSLDGQKKNFGERMDEEHTVVMCDDVSVAQEQIRSAVERARSGGSVAGNGGGHLRVVGVATGAGAVSAATSGTVGDTIAKADEGLPKLMDDVESRFVTEAMHEVKNNQVRAARILKITRGALQYKLKKYVPRELGSEAPAHSHESKKAA